MCVLLSAALFWVIITPAQGGGGTLPRCPGPGGQTYDPATQQCCGSAAIGLEQSCCQLIS
jgi:hypothetical protein